MGSYREHALDGASAVDLVVALYDGILRFLYAASAAVERRDEDGRRAAVKRALDIIIHLQARLRMDVGGRPAQALSEFYTSIFAQILQASQSASKAKFDHAINCVKNVRDAWRQVAKDPNANLDLPRVTATAQGGRTAVMESSGSVADGAAASRWTA
ncbi:MAG: flagellar export chaperone FliS [Terracidiphilus sp.]|jgi:flagellar protein FliS